MNDVPLDAHKRSRQMWLRALEMTAPIGRNPSLTLPALIHDLSDKFGPAPALLAEGECMTYRMLSELANRYARFALGQRIEPGDVVCLLMPNCPEYMAVWLGITRVGGVVALLNTNLMDSSLVHAIDIVAPKHLIVAGRLAQAVAEIMPRLATEVKIWSHGPEDTEFPRIEDQLRDLGGHRIELSQIRAPSIRDRALYIYTSGTTGLPKAAIIDHSRLMQWAHWFAGMMDTGPTDRMYNVLPMYHSIGGIVATGALLVSGGAVVLRSRFSASEFWDDVVKWDCTLFQYIGEMCRYLVDAPPHPKEGLHRLRLCCGNGMSGPVWQRFAERFRVPRILEFYAATEGTFSLYNCEGKPGAIGRIPAFLAHRFPVALVKFDVDGERPLRDDEGLCMPCAVGEVGEILGRIHRANGHQETRFNGYTDREASDQKIIRNVLARGDAWFRTGDLMRRDEQGYFYFIDRIGDTFRWKGENVSTTEVASTIAAHPEIRASVVYGVEIPGNEGRVGMAAITTDGGLDLASLRRWLVDRLPEYARPLFVRICSEIETTSTFKPRTQNLVREGFDPTKIRDPIYFDDRVKQSYQLLGPTRYRQIRCGRVKL